MDWDKGYILWICLLISLDIIIEALPSSKFLKVYLLSSFGVTEENSDSNLFPHLHFYCFLTYFV